MTEVCYTLTLTVQAPLLSQSVGALAFGYDKASLSLDQAAVFPGSLIRGNLRHALQRFAQLLGDAGKNTEADTLQKDILRWFGAPSSEVIMTPQRAQLQFDYYWKTQTNLDEKIAPRHRISLDEETDCVKAGHLLVIETPYEPGKQINFSGEIIAHCEDEDERRRLTRWLRKAAVYIPALGALKGVGFGKLLDAHLEEQAELEEKPTPAFIPQGDETRIRLWLTLDRPFCVAEAHTPDSNVFHGAEIIPGGVLKGALAKRLDEKQKSDLAFDQLVFTHAKPAHATQVIPWSMCSVGGKIVDLALLAAKNAHITTPAFLCKTQNGLEAPTFQVDWKAGDWHEANKICGIQAEIKRHLAVHTAIDAASEVSAEGQLFSLDCVDPQEQRWVAEIDISAVSETQRAQAQVLTRLAQALSTPLRGIGKTKAKACAVLKTCDLPGFPEVKDGFFIITLQTPARLLLSMDDVAPSGGAAALQTLYDSYWQIASNKQLQLVSYFARQSRVGGQFLYRHYWRKRNDDKSYEPCWLTDSGSVFVVRLAESNQLEQALTLLQQWQRLGLPQPPEGGDSSGAWQWNPYIRENGYGAIRVNDPIHQEHQAREEDWECLQ